MKKNDIYTVYIEDMNNLGNGVAHIDKMAVFVPGGVTGDKLNIKIIKVLSDYAIARVKEVLSPSEKRKSPDCDKFTRCGGCTFCHIDFAYENELKRAYVENCFRKAGLNVKVEDTVYANDKSYRCKVEYPFNNEGHIGLYSKRSHEVVPQVFCQRQERILDGIVEYLDDYFSNAVKEKVYTVYNEESGKGLLRHIYLRYAKGSGKVLVCVVINGERLDGAEKLADDIFERFPFVSSFVLNINKEKTNVILGKKTVTVKGDGYIDDVVSPVKLRFSPLSFCQVNYEIMDLLYKKVASLASIRENEKVADLYCGVGSIGLCALSNSENSKNCSLVGVEIIPEAIENAKYNAKVNGFENVRYICADADSYEIEKSDIVIVDPPRKGCGEEIIKRIAEVSPEKVVYVSCNPDTLARDCTVFKKFGYVTETAYPYNMFPRTGHVETVVLLSRT